MFKFDAFFCILNCVRIRKAATKLAVVIS